MAFSRKEYSIEQAIKEMGKDIKELTTALEKEAKALVPVIAAQAHGMIVEKAQERLKARRQMYLDALDIKQISASEDNEVWAVTLNKSAGWIEEGMPAGERIEMIINGGKPAKTSKSGAKYKIIPFQYNKKPSMQSSADAKLARYVDRQLKAQGLDKTIMGKDGKPILGKAASVKITDPNQPVGKGNKPLLQGLTIYQSEKKNKKGESKIHRQVMTFRVISTAQKGSGMWEWKEQKGVHIFDEVAKQIDDIFGQAIQSLAARI